MDHLLEHNYLIQCIVTHFVSTLSVNCEDSSGLFYRQTQHSISIIQTCKKLKKSSFMKDPKYIDNTAFHIHK